MTKRTTKTTIETKTETEITFSLEDVKNALDLPDEAVLFIDVPRYSDRGSELEVDDYDVALKARIVTNERKEETT